MERSAADRDDDERPRSRWELVRAGLGEPGGLSGRSLSRWRGLAVQARTVWKGWARRTSGSPGPAPNRGCGSRCGFRRHWGDCPPAVGLLGAVRAARVVAIERCSDLAEPLCAQLAPVRELVVSIPAPRCDHREHEDPTIAK